MKKRMRPYAGLTLIELMTAVAIGALLLALGVPAMGHWIRASRMTTAANDVLLVAHLARTEAIKRRVPVTVCIATRATPGTCVAGPDVTEDDVWTVFVDANRNLVTDTGLVPLRVVDAPPDAIRSTLLPVPDGSQIPFLSFGQDGFAIAAGDMTNTDAVRLDAIVLCDLRGLDRDSTSAGSSPARVALVNGTGRLSISRDATQIGDALEAAGLDEGDCVP
jgi:type IV fimbrial biogenesis protein FimT